MEILTFQPTLAILLFNAHYDVFNTPTLILKICYFSPEIFVFIK